MSEMRWMQVCWPEWIVYQPHPLWLRVEGKIYAEVEGMLVRWDCGDPGDED